MIKIINFDVGQADCILVHFEETILKEKAEQGETALHFNLLVDGGFKKNKIREKLDECLGKQEIQGVVVTHLDQDHIAGILDLISGNYNKVKDAFLLFNKYDDTLVSYKQAKTLAETFNKNFASNLQIKSYEENFSESLMGKINRNSTNLEVELLSLEQRIMCPKMDENKVTLTVLGPKQDDVLNLMRIWNDNKKDAAIINRSSIVLLLEYEGKAILLSGDGEFSYIKSALERIEDLEKIDIIKAAHHGAENNNIGLVEVVRDYHCKKVFFTIDENEYVKRKLHPALSLLQELSNLKDSEGKGIVLTCSSEIQNEELKENLICEHEMIVEG